MNFIDLFAGAGGLSEGFVQAGFTPIAHVEMDKAACFTLKTRAVYHELKRTNRFHIYESYLKGDITRDDLYRSVPESILNTVINSKIGGYSNRSVFKAVDNLVGQEEVDLIIGGPPCQAYSPLGRAAMGDRVKDDERNFLYKEYAKFLMRYNPRFFVFENVPGLKSAGGGKIYKDIKKLYKSIGYELDDRLLNAWDFGVVQQRERLIIIGWREDIEFEYPEFTKVQNNHTVNDIFEDLPQLKPGEGSRYTSYLKEPASTYLLDSGIRNGLGYVTHHVTRPHNERDRKIYGMAIDLASKGIRIKNDMIPTEDRTQKNIEDFLDRFKVVCSKPHTMIAHIAKDGHHFIHPDRDSLRSISVREAARIQSFPDNYFFEGVKEHQNRSASFKQIGNAVPPLMSYKIANTLRDII
ncbi:MAG: DNA cytosine methyltransferase [Bacteroidetes bacterium]|nr:DNA cytosine methyltransferase [Bacteroidota bacterium]